MSNENARMQILEMIDSGKVSADEGLRLLQSLGDENQPALEAGQAENEADETLLTGQPAPRVSQASLPGADTLPGEAGTVEGGETADTRAGPLPPEVGRWRRWWMIPLWIGVSITVAGGLLMYWALQASGVSVWFFLAGLPFFVGLLIMILGWQSRTSPWLHLRVEQRSGEWPQHISLSFPLPLRLGAWFFRNFGHKIPNLQGTSIDELILALGNTASSGNPLYIDVEEGESGEKVQIFIG